MRTALLLLLAIGLASAQFEKDDAALVACEKGCCLGSGGNWSNDSASCAIATYPKAYVDCESACFANVTGSIQSKAPRSDFCCAPAAVLGMIGIAALLIRE